MKAITTLIILCFINFSWGQLSNGLVAYFPFNGNCNDISTNTIVGVDNGVIYGVDRNGMSNETMYNAASNYASFQEAAVKPVLPISISVWVKFNNHNQPNIIFMSDNVYNNSYGYWLSGLINTGQIAINFGGGLGTMGPGNKRSFVTDQSLSIGVWHHVIAIIKDYNDMDVYLDCIKATGSYSGTGSTTIVYSTSESRIGSSIGNTSNNFGNFFYGDIDQIAIWDRELSLLEIDTLCNTANTLGLKEDDSGYIPASFSVNPNPATDIIHVKGDAAINKVSVIDLQGRIVLEVANTYGTKSIDIDLINLPKSSYLLKIELDDTIVIKRIIKL